MGITKTPDGRYLVGKGISDANNYKGALGKRDILIQYTADGVTPDSMNSLLYLVDYATSHGEANELIVPPGISVWVAKNDKLTAVEADDIYIDDDAFHIGPISYDGSDWTFGDPTDTGGSFPTPTEADSGKVLTAGEDGTASWQTASGGGGGVPTPTASDIGKILTATASEEVIAPEQTVTFDDGVGIIDGVTISASDMHIGDHATLFFDSDEYALVGVDMSGFVAYAYSGEDGEYILFLYNSDADKFLIFGSVIGATESAVVKITKESTSATASWQTASGGNTLTNPYVISVRADVYSGPQAIWKKSNVPAFTASNVTVDLSGNEVTVGAQFFCVSDSDFAKIFSAKAPFSLVEKYENPQGFTGATSVAVVWGQEPYNILDLIGGTPSQHYTFVPQLTMVSDSFYDTEHSPGIVTSDVIIVSIYTNYGVPQSIIAVVPESVKFRDGGIN